MPGWNGNFPLFHTIREPEIQSCSEKLWKSNSDPQKRKYLLICGGIFHFLKLLTNFVTWLSIEKFVHSNFFLHDGQFQIREKKNQFAQICVTWSELLQQIWNVRTSNFSCDQKFYQDFVPSFLRVWCFDDILLCNVAWMGHSTERRIKLVIAWRGEFHKDMSFALSNMFPIAVCGRLKACFLPTIWNNTKLNSGFIVHIYRI